MSMIKNAYWKALTLNNSEVRVDFIKSLSNEAPNDDYAFTQSKFCFYVRNINFIFSWTWIIPKNSNCPCKKNLAFFFNEATKKLLGNVFLQKFMFFYFIFIKGYLCYKTILCHKAVLDV